MEIKRDFGEEPIVNLLIKYSIPAIIGMLVTALYNVVDRIYIGKIPSVGSLAMTGVGITVPISTIIMAFGMLIGMGTTANVSIKLGQKKEEEAEKLIGNALTLCIIISLILTITGLIFCKRILIMFGASEKTLFYANDYIIVILIGTVFNVLGFALNNVIRADGSPKTAAATMIIGCFLNIILDPIFIFTFGLGVKGAAIATVISQIVSAIWIIFYFTKGKSNIKLKRKNFKLNLNLIKIIFAIGVSPFSMQIAGSVVQIISNNQLKLYGGDLAIGAMTAISSIAMLFLMPIFGINQGSQPIIGYNYGAKKYDRSTKTLIISILVATVYLILGFIIVQLFPKFLIEMFNKDSELMKIGVRGIKIYLFTLPILAVSIAGPNYFQNTGKPKIAIFLSLLRQVILLIPLLLILPNIMGLDGIWYSQPICDVIATAVNAFFIIRDIKRYKVKI